MPEVRNTRSRRAMHIDEAIAAASAEHVVMLHLTAYVQTLQAHEQTRSLFGGHVARLPIDGEADVIARLVVLHEMLALDRYADSPLRPVLEEACGVLSAALDRLHTLAPAKPAFTIVPNDQSASISARTCAPAERASAVRQ